ncbi:MAG: thioredoxin family protein [Firmicutes bacterium]|nr:thioredoxin family protein [Bacillota bacterium]
MIVKVFMGCCGGGDVLDYAKEAVKLSGVDATVEAVTDLAEVMKARIMTTPAIKINNKVVSGRMPKVQDLAKLIADIAAKES